MTLSVSDAPAPPVAPQNRPKPVTVDLGDYRVFASEDLSSFVVCHKTVVNGVGSIRYVYDGPSYHSAIAAIVADLRLPVPRPAKREFPADGFVASFKDWD